jgi:hypothetical protein
MTFSTTWRVAALGAGYGAMLLLAASCQDAPLGPLAPQPTMGARPANGASMDVIDSPAIASATFSINGSDPVPSQLQDVGYYPVPTIVQIDVHQAIDLAPLLPGGVPGFLGLRGRGIGNDGCSGQGEAMLIDYLVDGGFGPVFSGCDLSDPNATSHTDTLSVNGSLQYVWSGDSSCPPPASACASYSGSSGIVVSRLPASLDMSVETNGASLGALPAGHGITVTGRPNPAQIGSFATPLTLIGGGWYFTNAAGVTSPFGCDLFVTPGTLTCSPQLFESGSFSLHAVVNGLHITGTPYAVTVVQPTITISLSRETVAVGDTVIVSTTVTPAGERQDQEEFRLRLTLDSGAAPPPVIFSRGQTPLGTMATTNAVGTPHTHAADAVPAPVPACQPTHPLLAKCYLVTNTAGSLKITESVRYNGVTVSAEKVVRVGVPPTVDTLPPRLKVTGPQAFGEVGPPVTFTAAAPGATSFSVTSWAFHLKAGASESLTPSRSVRSVATAPAPPAPCGNGVTCTIIPNGAGYAVAYAMVNGNAEIDSAYTAPFVTIRKVARADAGGSFTTLDGEDTINLEAEVNPPGVPGAVQWQVTDLATDKVDSPVPQRVANGAVSSFFIPVSSLDPARWPKVHFAGIRTSPYQSLAYQVVASVTVDGVTYLSKPRSISQDVFDTIRQEFIDLDTPKGVPPRGMIGAHDNNQGDYLVNVTNADFDQKFSQLKAAWGTRAWQVNGYFRNPVHNKWHVEPGQSSGTVPGSWHQYGCAADLQTFPTHPANKADSLKAISFWNDMVGEAKKLSLHVEPLGTKKKGQAYSGLGHVHVNVECYPGGQR